MSTMIADSSPVANHLFISCKRLRLLCKVKESPGGVVQVEDNLWIHETVPVSGFRILYRHEVPWYGPTSPAPAGELHALG